MIPDTGGIPTFCYCTHHALDHTKVAGCEECSCPGFVAKSAWPWRDDEHALVPTVRRYHKEDLIKEDSHG